MTIREIVNEWLKNNGFDGLFSSWDCGCEISDLMPCVEGFDNCEPGYKVPCECEEECGFHIVAKKPEAADE